MKKKALGRGLKSLIPDQLPAGVATISAETSPEENKASMIWVHPSEITPNQQQPRAHFDTTRLQELADSIQRNGMMQPVVVRKDGAGYELIAGERRWRAIQLLGLTEIPVIVREDVAKQQALELSLLENVQRENLNPIEEATAYQRMATEFHMTQEAIALSVGKDRSTVANAMRLLKLPTVMIHAVRDGAISMGHARTLLGVADRQAQQKLFEELLVGETSVRAAEAKVAHTRHNGRQDKKDPEVVALEEAFGRALGTKVRIAHHKQRGKITIEYYSLDDLDRIQQVILDASSVTASI